MSAVMTGTRIQQLFRQIVTLVFMVCRLWRQIPGGATAREHPAPNPHNGPFRPTPAGQAPMGRCRQDFWGTCSAIHRESARPVPSSATLTDHERSKRKSMFTKQDTDDRPTPRCCLPTGSPLPELRPRGLVEPGQPTWKHSACLCCRCFADNARRCFCTGHGRWLVF